MKLNNIINRIKQINPEIKFVGTFDENNRRTGYWKKYYPNGDIWYNGNYLNGKPEGYWEGYWSNGNLMYKGNYLNGKADGYWERYYSNGKIEWKGNYVNGKFYEL